MTDPAFDYLTEATNIPALAALPPDERLAALDTLTYELTMFACFEALATDNGRIDETGNGYRPTLRANREQRYTLLADAYDYYQVLRGSFKRALRK